MALAKCTPANHQKQLFTQNGIFIMICSWHVAMALRYPCGIIERSIKNREAASWDAFESVLQQYYDLKTLDVSRSDELFCRTLFSIAPFWISDQHLDLSKSSADDIDPVKGQIIVSFMSREGPSGSGNPLAIVSPGGDILGPSDDSEMPAENNTQPPQVRIVSIRIEHAETLR